MRSWTVGTYPKGQGCSDSHLEKNLKGLKLITKSLFTNHKGHVCPASVCVCVSVGDVRPPVKPVSTQNVT